VTRKKDKCVREVEREGGHQKKIIKVLSCFVV